MMERTKGTFTAEEILLAEDCIRMAQEKGADKVRITLNKSCMDLTGTLNGEVDKVTHCMDRSISITIYVDGRCGSFSINRLEKEALEDFIGVAIETTRVLAKDECKDLPSPERTAKDASQGNELGLYDPAYDSIEAESRLEKALNASIYKEVTEAPAEQWKLISEELEYSDCAYDTLVLDSNGLRCRHMETSYDFGAEMTIEDAEGNKFSGRWWHSSTFADKLETEECCRKAIAQAVRQLGPKRRRSGKYTMVVDSECASRLVSPVLNALSGFSIQQNNSFLLDAVGKKLFSEGMTIEDRCRRIGETGSRLFDSEGVATTEHSIIENGVVKEYFVNTYISNKTGMAPTIEDATRPALKPWPEAGMDKEKIMKKCRNGILVTGFNGGNSNATTGDFSFGIEGFAFKDGKITHPVHEMLITGNLITLWNQLVAVGDDARPCMSKLIPTLAFSKVDFSG